MYQIPIVPKKTEKKKKKKKKKKKRKPTKTKRNMFLSQGHSFRLSTPNEPPIDGWSGPGPGSMGVESQEGSLYMTEERWQKIRIATEPWWLE